MRHVGYSRADHIRMVKVSGDAGCMQSGGVHRKMIEYPVIKAVHGGVFSHPGLSMVAR